MNEPRQRKSSRKSSNGNRHGWNENQHGERQSSMMIITERESSYSRWKMGIVMDGMKMVVV